MAGENEKKEENPFESFQDHSDEDNIGGSSDDDGGNDQRGDDDGGKKDDDEGQKELNLDDDDGDDDDELENTVADEGADEGEGDDDDDDDEEGDDPAEGEGAGHLDDDDDDGDEPAPRKNRSVKERISEFRKRTGNAERRADTAERRLQQSEARLAALEEAALTDKDKGGSAGNEDDDFGLTKPDPTKYQYGELDAKYQEDVTDYKVDLRLAQRDAKNEVSQQEVAARETVEALKVVYDDRVVDGIKAYGDFEKVVIEAADNGEFPLGETIGTLALHSDVGHHILYKIAGNLKLAKKLDAMTPVQQGREFGRLEAQFAKRTPPKKKNKPNAGPPASRRRGGKAGAGRVKGNTSDFSAFENQARADEASRRKR